MLEWVPAGLNTGALGGAKASSSRTRDNNFSRFGSKYITSSSIIISLIISLFISSFNIFLITFIIRKKY
jgi:hypothetical protein